MRGRKPNANAIRRGMTDALAEYQDKGYLIEKPEKIARDPLQSEIWDLIVPEVGRYSQEDVPMLVELVTWHAVYDVAKQQITDLDGTLVHTDGFDDAVNSMKKATAEIRALSSELSMSPAARARQGLMQASTVKTAAETARMFMSMDELYPEIEAAYDID